MTLRYERGPEPGRIHTLLNIHATPERPPQFQGHLRWGTVYDTAIGGGSLQFHIGDELLVKMYVMQFKQVYGIDNRLVFENVLGMPGQARIPGQMRPGEMVQKPPGTMQMPQPTSSASSTVNTPSMPPMNSVPTVAASNALNQQLVQQFLAQYGTPNNTFMTPGDPASGNPPTMNRALFHRMPMIVVVSCVESVSERLAQMAPEQRRRLYAAIMQQRQSKMTAQPPMAPVEVAPPPVAQENYDEATRNSLRNLMLGQAANPAAALTQEQIYMLLQQRKAALAAQQLQQQQQRPPTEDRPAPSRGRGRGKRA
jgi:hypothetical protein